MAANITAIITKIRRLTRSPSQAQISDGTIIDYINTFLLYDFPEHLRTFNYHETFTFTCNPYQDVYPVNITNPAYSANPLFNFQNLYLTVNPPLYIAGFQQQYTQSQEQFFGIYPKIQSINQFTFGDGITTTFTGQINSQQAIIAPGQNINASLLQNQVLFSSLDANNNGLAMVDVPVVNTNNGWPTTQGNLYPEGNLPTTPPTVVNPNNTVNYVTGAFTVTFQTATAGGPVNTAPGANQPVSSQSVQVQAARPQMMLYFDNAFTLRPVPDQPYMIQFEVFKRPIALDQVNNTNPDLEEYWQFIAYGAARKVLQDRLDMDTVALLEPEYNQQLRLVLRRTIVQNKTQRVATIYTENSDGANVFGWGYGGGQF